MEGIRQEMFGSPTTRVVDLVHSGNSSLAITATGASRLPGSCHLAAGTLQPSCRRSRKYLKTHPDRQARFSERLTPVFVGDEVAVKHRHIHVTGSVSTISDTPSPIRTTGKPRRGDGDNICGFLLNQIHVLTKIWMRLPQRLNITVVYCPLLLYALTALPSAVNRFS